MTMRPTRPNRRDGTRGQAFTLEAIVAAVVVLAALLFALEVSGVTASTGSTAGGEAVSQGERLAAGALDAAVANATLGPTLRYWDPDEAAFHRTGLGETYYSDAPPTALGRDLEATLGRGNLAYNVELHYVEPDGSLGRQVLVRNGVPSDDAARATRTVTLYDDDQLLNADGTASNATLDGATFYVPDRYPDDPLYNVVRVEVVVWRV